MAPKPWLIVHMKERSITIGRRAGKFWGKNGIFWAPIWGGLKFSEPARGEGYNFLGAFGRCARTNGFCVTEILSTAWNTMAVQVILTELHTQRWIARLKSTHWLEMRSDFMWNSLQFAWLWNGFKNSARELRITRLRMKAQQNRLMN